MSRPPHAPLRVVVLGALSDIAAAACRRYAAQGAHLLLAARDGVRLEQLAADLRVRGATVSTRALDLAADGAGEPLAGWIAELGGADVVLLAYGVLGDQRAMEGNPGAAGRLIDVNFRSAALWCLSAGAVLAAQGRGVLCVIGSVAGDRGRQSNYLYGATKAGLAVLVEGLDHRLASTDARAILVKPGFVSTAMTAHLGARGPLWASADRVAGIVLRAVERGRAVTYAPGFWRWVMAAVRAAPRAVMHRTRL